MRTAAAWRSLGAIDLRSVLRDPLLRWIAVLIPLFGVLLRFGVPEVATAMLQRTGADLATLHPLLMSFVPIIVAALVGIVIGFLLLDQRDDQTLPALLVTPLSLGDYLRYRLLVPMALCLVLTWITLPLAGLTRTSALQMLVTSLTAAPLAPIYALFLGSFAANKVQGFALAKAMGVVIVPCIIAYFVAGPWQLAFGLVPHYWPMKAFWLFDAGETGAALLHALVGVAWQAVLVAALARRFLAVVHR